ncbi:Tyrosine recombinase XerC [Methylobacterium cerastii]|uniref:Tyrosine recombinase XerC n=1 Tax=Methylobacterium cerastii TaxID=932741 RepID=A0ABQ4QFC1_9HYPH|nr:site-specific integrase [Methylobacterium cerastii]GJD43817.1 Tyrosine recombinase XerC [Methylobacterium cerastii]
MATIRKRGSSWQAQVRRDGSRPTSKSFNLKTDAVRWARDIERDIEQGEHPSNIKILKKLTLSDLLTRYEECITSSKKGANQEHYKLRLIHAHPIAALNLSYITSKSVADYRDSRLQIVQPSTVRRELAVLQHCFEIATKEWGIPLASNPVRNIKLPDVSKARQTRLNIGDEERLNEALRQSRIWYLQPLVKLAIETGMRRGELLSLRWSNVNFLQRTARLEDTKNGHSRTIPLTPTAIKLLQALPKNCDLIIPVSGNAVRLAWERLRARAELPDLRFHDLRHEAISRMTEMGLTVPEVAMISGHRDYKMLARYTHIRPENVAKKLADIHERQVASTTTEPS